MVHFFAARLAKYCQNQGRDQIVVGDFGRYAREYVGCHLKYWVEEQGGWVSTLFSQFIDTWSESFSIILSISNCRDSFFFLITGSFPRNVPDTATVEPFLHRYYHSHILMSWLYDCFTTHIFQETMFCKERCCSKGERPRLTFKDDGRNTKVKYCDIYRNGHGLHWSKKPFAIV